MAELILFNKPYRVLSQFRDRAGRATLGDYLEAPGFYPAGRLDYDSEGLLLLTDDGALQQRITDPAFKLWKTYLLQVEGTPTPAALQALRSGVSLRDGPTRPARVRPVAPPPWLWPREPPVRERRQRPTQWLEVALREGRNRQLRRMTAAVGLPTLRLLRSAIGDWHLDGLAPGQLRRLRVHLPRDRHRPGR